MKKLLTWVLIMMLAVFMPLGTLAEGLEVEYDESANTAVMASEESLTDNESEIIASESECPVENDDVVSECFEMPVPEEDDLELSADDIYADNVEMLDSLFSSDPEKAVMADNTYIINNHAVYATIVSDPGNGQCWEYANRIYEIIWGSRFTSDFTGSPTSDYNMLRNLSDSDRALTAEHLKNYIAQASLGAVIRIVGCTSNCADFNSDGLNCSHHKHSLILVAKNDNGFTTLERLTGPGRREKTWTWDSFCSAYSDYPYIKYIKWPNAGAYQGKGSEMSYGYNRALPDGDYIIAAASDPLYYLDISGGAVPADNYAKIQLWHVDNLNDFAENDVWTVSYNSSDKFYTIKQKGTNMCLDVSGEGLDNGAKVQLYSSNGQLANPKTNRWAITPNGRNGYRLKAKCSGFSLDMPEGLTRGVNLRQSADSDSMNQTWVFIPYKPVQPIEEGRYIILTDLNQGYEIDLPGDTADMGNGTNVRLWDIGALAQYNSFDAKKLANGYYTLTNTASGRLMDVNGGGTAYGSGKGNVGLWENNGGRMQQWAITQSGNGYILRSRFSGYTLDIESSTATNGANLCQYPYSGGASQVWHFIPAEYTVVYNANGGSAAPESQIKYYNSTLKLSTQKPTRNGYTFTGWTTSKDSESIKYLPGASYNSDSDVVLYAHWELVNATQSPTVKPTLTPSIKPTVKPTSAPTAKPTTAPTVKPTAAPTEAPVQKPTEAPSGADAAAEKTLADNTAAAAVLAKIKLLPENAGTSDKAAVEAARTAYDALTNDQKMLVSAEALSALLIAESQIKAAEKTTNSVNLSMCEITVKAQAYTGKALTPAVTVSLNGKTLKKGTDYTVSYKNNKAIGTATVTIKGKGNYTGTATATFKINPKKVSGLKLQAGKKLLTLTWKKVAGVTGYQIQYGLKSNFKGAKLLTVKKDKTVKKVLKSLKSGKVYYVRVRAYKKVGKATYYSAWSKAVKKKTK